jgi:hypothetical protein
MQKALMRLNIFGCQVKKGVKMHFLCFYPSFEPTLDSLTTIQVKPHQCPLHQLILLIQGPIPKIFAKNIENRLRWKMIFFWLLRFKKKEFVDGFFRKVLEKTSSELICTQL